MIELGGELNQGWGRAARGAPDRLWGWAGSGLRFCCGGLMTEGWGERASPRGGNDCCFGLGVVGAG